jgi:acyl carrier protein
MTIATQSGVSGRTTVFQDLVGILQDMTGDWDLQFEGGIGEETLLIGDLGFESIDVVQLVVAIEEHYGRRDLPMGELLMSDGRYVTDLRVGAVVDFLAKNLGK